MNVGQGQSGKHCACASHTVIGWIILLNDDAIVLNIGEHDVLINDIGHGPGGVGRFAFHSYSILTVDDGAAVH